MDEPRPLSALMETLRHAWRTLEPLGAPMAVMGGLALSVWEHFRATNDVDLLIGVDDIDTEAVLAKLIEAGIHPRRDPPVTVIGEIEFIQAAYEPPETYVDLKIDILLAKSEYHRQALQRRITVPLPDAGFEVAVLRCEDLIILKLLAGRIIDRVDVIELLKSNRDRLDYDYLSTWLTAEQLTSNFVELWQEAFPGERAPVHYDEE